MKHIITALLLLLAFNAAAIEPTTVADMSSQPGESKKQFVMRVATFLHHWTLANNAEACGPLVTTDNGFSVHLATLGSQRICRMPKAAEYIHSHPFADKHGFIKITDRTREVHALLGRSETLGTVYDTGTEGFSPEDFAVGPGYVVDGGHVYYQNGAKTERQIGRVK